MHLALILFLSSHLVLPPSLSPSLSPSPSPSPFLQPLVSPAEVEIQCPCWCHHCRHHYCHYSALPPADLSSAVADRACLLLNYTFIIREIRYYGTVIFPAVKYVPYLFHNTQFPLCMHHNIYPFCFVDGCMQCTNDLVTPLQNEYHPHYCPFGRSHPRAYIVTSSTV